MKMNHEVHCLYGKFYSLTVSYTRINGRKHEVCTIYPNAYNGKYDVFLTGWRYSTETATFNTLAECLAAVEGMMMWACRNGHYPQYNEDYSNQLHAYRKAYLRHKKKYGK